MSTMDFEYAIKTDVRNNPIVREVDRARQAALVRSSVISILLVIIVLFSVWQKFQLMRHGYEMQTLQRERLVEEELNRHLKLEIATLRAPRRIEEIAIRSLHLVQPTRDQAIVLERVTAPAPPSTSIVAAR